MGRENTATKKENANDDIQRGLFDWVPHLEILIRKPPPTAISIRKEKKNVKNIVLEKKKRKLNVFLFLVSCSAFMVPMSHENIVMSIIYGNKSPAK